MLRRVLFAIAITVSPTLAYAGPKEDAQAVFDRFLTAFTAANVDAVVGVLALVGFRGGGSGGIAPKPGL